MTTVDKKPFPVSLVFLIIFIAVVNGLAYEFSWYWRIPWLDMPMHFLGGFWVGSVALLFYSSTASKQFLQMLLFSVFSAILIGVLWELFEFNVDTITIALGQNGVLDTASDLIFDILGGGSAALCLYFKNNKNGQ